MRSEMVLRWFAKDGREFDSERDCRGYEREKETERDEEVARYKRELLHCHNLMEFAEKFRKTELYDALSKLQKNPKNPHLIHKAKQLVMNHPEYGFYYAKKDTYYIPKRFYLAFDTGFYFHSDVITKDGYDTVYKYLYNKFDFEKDMQPLKERKAQAQRKLVFFKKHPWWDKTLD